MFTGIIECLGTVERVENNGTNTTFWVSSPISHELQIDQSVSHNGVCLTVEEIKDNTHRVTAIAETLRVTNLGQWQAKEAVNLERCMLMNGRLDGHIVQGHVDATATCVDVKTLQGSWEYTFRFDKAFAHLIIEKGSITVNGTSLTCFNIGIDTFSVAIIPYTYEHTNIRHVHPGSIVNLEFDVIGKYIHRLQQVKTAEKS